MKQLKWLEDDDVCSGILLNAIVDTLFDIF